jgi:hypothetical protein
MVHFATVSAILLAVGNVAAQSIGTYSLLVPVYDQSEIPTTTLYGTIVSENPTKTTYLAGCVSDKCIPTDIGTQSTIFGPSSLDVAVTNTDTASQVGPDIVSLHCDFTGTTQAVCIESISGANGRQSQTATASSAAYQTIVATKVGPASYPLPPLAKPLKVESHQQQRAQDLAAPRGQAVLAPLKALGLTCAHQMEEFWQYLCYLDSLVKLCLPMFSSRFMTHCPNSLLACLEAALAIGGISCLVSKATPSQIPLLVSHVFDFVSFSPQFLALAQNACFEQIMNHVV